MYNIGKRKFAVGDSVDIYDEVHGWNSVGIVEKWMLSVNADKWAYYIVTTDMNTIRPPTYYTSVGSRLWYYENELRIAYNPKTD